MDATEFLRLVGGDLCPCGHEATEHDDPTELVVEGMHERFGQCGHCECRGVIGFDDEDDA